MKLRSGTSPSLKGKALQWLSQREHSRRELRSKLLRWLQREADSGSPPCRSSEVDPGSGRSRGELDEPDGHARGNDCAPSPDQPPRGVSDGDDRENAAARRREDEVRVDALLDELDAARHLSDERFVESRIHARQARFGNRRIEQELREHGLRPTPQELEQLRSSERDRARQVLRQRFGVNDPEATGAADRLRRTRFLAARGFSFDAIQAALRPADD